MSNDKTRGTIIDGWVTKYALTVGIERKRLEDTGIGEMVMEVGVRYRTDYHGEGKEWHRTYTSAYARAEVMRNKKIASLRKSLFAMERLTFPTTDPEATK